MRIGIDASCWWNNRGFGRFTRELLSEMFRRPRGHEFVVFTDEADSAVFDGFGVETVLIGADRKVIEAATANDRRSLGDVWSFARSARKQNLDIMFYPAVYSWFPPPRGVPCVVTFHDAIAEHFPELVFPHRRERLFWNAKTWLAKKSADKVLTVSEAAKREIITYLKVPEQRIDVICEGADDVFQRTESPKRRLEMREKFDLSADARLLVYVGGFAPHKNLNRLLDAFSQLTEAEIGRPMQLVMVGEPRGGGFHSVYEEIQHKIQTIDGLSDKVRFTGYISDEELAVLYSDALALALPSLSEGFGLPALEAMSCGTPVLAARDGAVMEVAGSAGLDFDPLDVGDIRRAISALATNPELESTLRAQTGPETQRNTWPQAADLTLDALETCRKGG